MTNSEKMTDTEAIEILSMELRHTESHKRIEGKASEYYEELSQIAEALKMGIDVLKHETYCEKDIDIPKMCEECHSESYSNGFDAGYELGKEDAQKHIAELNESIEILKHKLEVYEHISNLGDEIETRGDEECRT